MTKYTCDAIAIIKNIENHFIKAALDEGVLFKLILAIIKNIENKI